ncbi:MAG: uncharacterized membrane protein YcjF (UPF0283 family) [Paracoccaceae bacterium]
MARSRGAIFNAIALLFMCEDNLIAPLDLAARHAVKTAAAKVAMVSAFVSIALVDVVDNFKHDCKNCAYLWRLRGLLQNWRLLSWVLAHLAATGAIAVDITNLREWGHGQIVSPFGQAVIDLCRPMSFVSQKTST